MRNVFTAFFLLPFMINAANAADVSATGGQEIFFTGAVGSTDQSKPGTFDFNGRTLTFDRTGMDKEVIFMGKRGAKPPKNSNEPIDWADVTIDGTAYKTPLYK